MKDNNFKQIPKGWKSTDIGLIPEDWEFEKLGSHCNVFSGYGFKSEEFCNNGIPVIKIGDLQNGNVIVSKDTSRISEDYLTNERTKKFILEEGDVLIALTGATTGKVAVLKGFYEPMLLNQRVGKIALKDDLINQKFVQYVIQTKYYQKRIQDNILQSAQGNVSPGNLEVIKIPLPPLSEQKKIAHVLSKIQQAVETQEQIIKTTQELKKALMQKLFTEGLPASGGAEREPQKQTEIGLIPESWEVIELGKLFKLSSGKGRPEDISELPNGKKNVPIYGGNGILGYTELKMLDKPVLVIGRVGEYCGVTYVTKGISWISDNALYTKSILRDFNIYYMKEFLTYFDLNRFRNRGGQPLVTQGIIHEIKIGLPKIKEQNLISNYLESLNTKIEQGMIILHSYNDLFRSSLNQLMTGQIRVKDIKLNLKEIKVN